MVAAHLDQRDVLEALCRAGASVLLRDAGGTAREVAEAAGHESVAALLQGREEEEALEAEAASQEGPSKQREASRRHSISSGDG